METKQNEITCSKCESIIERNDLTDLFDNHETLLCQGCVNYRDNPKEFVKAAKEALNFTYVLRAIVSEGLSPLDEGRKAYLRKLLDEYHPRAEAAFVGGK